MKPSSAPRPPKRGSFSRTQARSRWWACATSARMPNPTRPTSATTRNIETQADHHSLLPGTTAGGQPTLARLFPFSQQGEQTTTATRNNFPKLHNAAWPGVVGKGPDSEPPISLDTMLDLTCAAEVNGTKFDGVDLFLFAPHVDIDASEDELKRLADKVVSRKLVVGSVVAPVWSATDGGSAMGSPEERRRFLEQVRKGCRIARRLRELGARPYGVVRIDSAATPTDWLKD